MMQKVVEQLTGKQFVRTLETYLEGNFESFAEVRSRYAKAVERLRNEGSVMVPSVGDVVDAIEKQTASNLFFSGVLGIKANLDHFMDPMARTVLDVDFDVFLREETARRLPAYEKTQMVIDAFYVLLTPTQKELFSDILDYISYLETTGPKLAHYYGFILGNEILPNLVLGYYPDHVLTVQYRAILEHYLGSGA
jgi:hypothetical protein